MNRNPFISAFCLAVCCIFLTGFKQHTPKLSTITKKHTADAEKSPKKLDLTVPKSEVSFQEQEPPELLATAQNESVLPGIDINKTNKNRELDLQGKVIMSQEPEAGKIKSADGAGIVINLHH
jgi:hypothetical protein